MKPAGTGTVGRWGGYPNSPAEFGEHLAGGLPRQLCHHPRGQSGELRLARAGAGAAPLANGLGTGLRSQAGSSRDLCRQRAPRRHLLSGRQLALRGADAGHYRGRSPPAERSRARRSSSTRRKKTSAIDCARNPGRRGGLPPSGCWAHGFFGEAASSSAKVPSVRPWFVCATVACSSARSPASAASRA